MNPILSEKKLHALGIDVGGSGIKGAVVDLETGDLLSGRHRLRTPIPATPEAVAETVAELCSVLRWEGPVGCGFPAAVRNGVVLTAASIDDRWIGVDGRDLLSQAIGRKISLINDADAAGIAEMSIGAGKALSGTVFVVTIGTGLGTALFVDGKLVPNTELGHIEIKGVDAELRASATARDREELPWKRWARRFNRYLETLERLFWPDCFILGGGAARKFDRFERYLRVETPVIPARFLNNAGIIGAAMHTTMNGRISK
jgi:polyphosphate glucokinase